MPELMPYLELSDPNSGRCLRLIDNCQTLANINHSFGEVEGGDCDECCPECEDQFYQGIPSQDGAWWADGNSPDSDLFWGFMATSVYLEPSASIRRRGESTADRPPWSPRKLTVVGRLIGDGPGGIYFGESAFADVLSDGCSPCDGWEATTRLLCPGPIDGDIIPPTLWEPDEQPPLTGDRDDCVPCSSQDPDWVPTNLFPPLGSNPTSIDSGRRSLMRLRFVYMDDIDEPEGQPTQLGSCAKWVQLVFEVQDDYEWGDPIEDVCNLDRGWDDYASGYCRPHDFGFCLSEPVLESCEDPTITASALVVESARSARARAGRYCSPLYRSVRSCLTPVLPTSADVALGVTIDAGSADLRNFRLDFFPAFNNVPSPESCEGELIYRRFKPCGQLLVPYLPAKSQLLIDGRRQETWLTCRSGVPEKASNYIENWDHPTFDPTCRMWVVAVVDCFNHADDMKVHPLQYFPRWAT